ncbi:hypothetical protein Mgra_00007105 [Meloidogyne graminicola]|uniref:Uncharacterized protein n=1 Tax=Meloidogyne graminicola TaxID=189291 RepID=A0A8S9ZK14_9BILA|nr:hypothetical protein Mgra_00007105 [Meloidogyne graminicola]
MEHSENTNENIIKTDPEKKDLKPHFFWSFITIFAVAISTGYGSQVKYSLLNDNPKHFFAPYTMMWFNNCCLVICFPVYLFYEKVIKKSQHSISQITCSSAHLFSGKDGSFKFSSFLFKELFFLFLYVCGNYSYALSLGKITSSAALVIRSFEVSVVYIFGRIVLKDKFNIFKTIAVFLAIFGVIFIALDKEFAANIFGFLLVVFSFFNIATIFGVAALGPLSIVIGILCGIPISICYFNISATKKFHYVLTVSKRNPTSDPVIVWFNGGPGASSLLGMFNEIGPYLISNDGKNLIENVHSWNNHATVLFIETPAGAGFSYATDKNYTNNDDQGLLIGNGMLSQDLNLKSALIYAYAHGVVEERIWLDFNKKCCNGSLENFDIEQWDDNCLNQAYDIANSFANNNMNIWNIYPDFCDGNKSTSGGYDQSPNACISDEARVNYMNNPDLLKALHIPTNLNLTWATGSQIVSKNYNIKTPKTPWVYAGQTAGIKTEYEGLTFITVIRAGHSVPQGAPGRSEYFLNQFLNNKPI